MAIDVYPVPAHEKVYIRQNLFSKDSQEVPKSSIGVNIYQDFAYTQANSDSYFAMTTGVTAVLNNWVEFGVFCSYWFPSATPISLDNPSASTMDLGNYVYCGNTLGFIVWPEKIFHPKFAVDVGIGSAKAVELQGTTTKKPVNIGYNLFIIKPAIVLETNLLSFLQWTLGFHYRFQISTYGPVDQSTLDWKASWPEFSTGLIFNVR